MTRAIDVIPHLPREGRNILWDVAFTNPEAEKWHREAQESGRWCCVCDIKMPAALPWATLTNPAHIYTGTGQDGQVIGLVDALIADSYAGIRRADYPEWKGNFLRAKGPLSGDIIKQGLRAAYVQSGMRPNLLLCHESAPRIRPTDGGTVVYDPDCPPNMAFLLNARTSEYEGYKYAYVFIAEMGDRSQLVVERPNTCTLILLEDA